MLTTIESNLLTMADNGDFDIICHGANCFHTMASGIAGQIVKK
jgi:O-acetyl-ADP-ribose deacetylase (regulator of RNase III)